MKKTNMCVNVILYIYISYNSQYFLKKYLKLIRALSVNVFNNVLN